MSVSKRGNKWQARLKEPHGGKYHRYSFATQDLAEAWLLMARQRIAEGLTVISPSESGRDLTISEFYNKHKDEIWGRGGIENSKYALKLFLKVNNDVPIKDLNNFHVKKYLKHCKDLGHKPKTINQRLSYIKILHKHAVELGATETELRFERQSQKDQTGRMKFLTEDEEKQLQDYFLSREEYGAYHMLNFLIDTGCRPAEAFNSRWAKHPPIGWDNLSHSAHGTMPDPVDPATGETRAVVSFGLGKTGVNSMRTIPLTPRAVAALEWSKLQNDPRPFANIEQGAWRSLLNVAKLELNLDPEIVPYTMRHTCASRLVQRGAPIVKVMRWMGHRQIETTMIYAKLRTSDVFDLSNLLVSPDLKVVKL